PGVVYALPRAIRALTEAGDGVILFTPVYYPFYRAVRHAGREIRSCPLRYENGRYSIDFDLFERLAAEERTTALLLCSPATRWAGSGRRRRSRALLLSASDTAWA